jgi:Kef-type K+ transport system membrane component KefB
LFEDSNSFLIVLVAAAVAPVVAGLASARWRSFVAPVVVAELLLGVLIGPQVLELAKPAPLLETFSQLGLGFLFFFAGYEIRIGQIEGRPLKLAGGGWLISLAIAYSLAGLLHASGLVLSGLLTGSALATTAIGTLIPVLRDEGRLGGNFGRQILAIGAVGEFGPILIVTVLLTASSSATEQLALLAIFIVIAVVTGLAASGAATRWLDFITSRMENSGQLPVRLAVLLVFMLVIVAGSLGMDVILGAFAAGLIMRLIIGEAHSEVFDSKMEAIGFGFLIPFFFIVSGMQIDVEALFSSVRAMIGVPIFVLLMFIVRGAPVYLLYKKDVPRDQIAPLALLSSTQLPLVVAITSIGLSEGHMRPGTAAALVTAAVVTVMVFPALALRTLNRVDPQAAQSVVG